MKSSSIRYLLPFMRPYRRRLLVAISGTALLNALALMPPLIFRCLVDDIVKPGYWDPFIFVLGAYAAVPIFAQFVQFLNTQNIVLTGQQVVADVRTGLYRLVLRLSMRYHNETSVGSLVTRIMGDVGMVNQLITGQTIQLVGDLIVFLFSLGVAFTIDARLASLLLAIVSLYVAAYRFFSRRIQTATHSMRAVNDVLVGRLQETLDGVRHVRIYNRELQERETYLQRTGENLQHAFIAGLSNVGLGSSCNAIAGYGSTLIYGLSAWYVVRAEMSLGDLLALNTYVWMALNPALRLTSFAGQFAQTRVSLNRVCEVLAQEPEIRDEPDATPIARGHGRVEFDGVRFGYKPDDLLFDGLDLTVEPGETVALVGHTGCGKTTLTALLMRLWDIQGGEIRIDGTDIRKATLHSLCKCFGVVLQNPVIFDGTVAENIAYACPGAPREAIEEAARASEILQFSDHLPDGLDTVLGSYGTTLSVGQKQRISIARAVLQDPAILIMDEATSAIDSEAEAAIQRAIARVLRNRTSFIVAHRLSTITGAHKIVVLDHGRIVEVGTHEELLAQENGVYRGLYEELTRTEAPSC